MSCTCEVPRESPNPRSKGQCAVCGKRFDPHWLSSDATVAEFFDYLENTFMEPEIPESFQAFRRQCEARERAGRDQFGLAYLIRENTTEATEEFTDGANYLFFDVLQHRRCDPASEDEDMALALEGARYAFLAHRCARELAAKRKGMP